MHIFFSGIGGSGIGPLAIIAKKAGYDVSGSDLSESPYLDGLRKEKISVIIGQSQKSVAEVHAKRPIDLLVRSSAVKDDNPEIVFANNAGIKVTKRDELLNTIINDHKLKLIAVAGTHGKTTTTAMLVWLFKSLNLPVSYSVGAKIPFGDMGDFNPKSEYFVYECDEFDRNFLAFQPHLSLITGISWDHHEIFKTRAEYNQAFRDFLSQSKKVYLWAEDLNRLDQPLTDNLLILDQDNEDIDQVNLYGKFNRRDAWLAIHTLKYLGLADMNKLLNVVDKFPGLKQRMEELAPNLFTNYAHTPEKIQAALHAAKEIQAEREIKRLTVIYEPLTNRRQHYIRKEYKHTFDEVDKLYWVPSYLAREDPAQQILTPANLIQELNDPKIAEPALIDAKLLANIRSALKAGDLVVAIGASGTGSMDEWLRANKAQF